jgi:hypothetical protein
MLLHDTGNKVTCLTIQYALFQVLVGPLLTHITTIP